MLGMICYLIPIPRCSKIWLAKLKSDWMNCLSTQIWEKMLFSIFVWRILGMTKNLLKGIQIRNFDFYEIYVVVTETIKTTSQCLKSQKIVKFTIEQFWHCPISNSGFDKKYQFTKIVLHDKNRQSCRWINFGLFFHFCPILKKCARTAGPQLLTWKVRLICFVLHICLRMEPLENNSENHIPYLYKRNFT